MSVGGGSDRDRACGDRADGDRADGDRADDERADDERADDERAVGSESGRIRPAESASASGRPRLTDRECVLLFDLDGTLVDTRQDITSGMAGLFRDWGLEPPSLERVIANVGRGVRNLVVRSLEEAGHPIGGPDVDGAVERFREHYAIHLLDTTVPYPGIDEMLRELRDCGRILGVVSNKPVDFTRRILEGLNLSDCFRVALGGDSLLQRKPDPAPLLHALEVCAPGAPPSSAVFVGDSVVDGEAAQRAGMRFAAVHWGFDPEGTLPDWPAEYRFERPEELARAVLGG